MSVAVLGIDLGKSSCSLAGLDEYGKVALQKRVRRENLIRFVAEMPVCAVAMEACCGAHYLARRLIDLGYDVRLIAPQFVKPFVKSQKNDDNDAEAIAVAATLPTMRHVTVKEEWQLDLQSLHRVRERLVTQRTAIINQIRGLLLERGLIISKGKTKLSAALPDILADEDNGLSPRIRRLLTELRQEWRTFDDRISELDAEFAHIAHQDAATRRLLEIPGIGPLIATALVAAIGKGEVFNSGRDLAAWLGLVPRQMTTGGKPKLLGISKRGNGYVRRMIIHGARATIKRTAAKQTPLGNWAHGVLERRHYNVAVVALANKLARISWAVVHNDTDYTEFSMLEAA